MTATCDVRPARLGDYRSAARMLERTWMTTYAEMIGVERARRFGRPAYRRTDLLVSHFARRLGRMPGHAALVARLDGRMVGYATYSEDPDGAAVLWMLYVDPERQGSGVGTQLLQAIVARCPRAKTLRLEVLQKNDKAIAWYQRHGFEIFASADTALSGNEEPVHYMDRRL
jgi:ribosomal protein S18 acetylase RimI-like enzyme